MKTKRSKGTIRSGYRSPFRSLQRAEQKPEILGPVPVLNCKAQAHYVAVSTGRVSAGQPTMHCFSAFIEELDAVLD